MHTLFAAANPALNAIATVPPASIYFIDASLPDLHTLLSGLPEGAQVQLLPAQSDGLKFMADALLGRSDIDALHLICHGAPGRLFLGSVAVGMDSLPSYANELYAISDAMAEDGQWLIYGCEVAQGVEGRRFVEGLRLTTGLQVAAATHKVGAAELGGSWVLDDVSDMARQAGVMMHPLAVPQWRGVLAAPVINGIDGSDAGSFQVGSYVYLDGGTPYGFISDADSANLNGGYLSVAYSTGTANGAFRFDPNIYDSTLNSGIGGATDTVAILGSPNGGQTLRTDGSINAEDTVLAIDAAGVRITLGIVDALDDGQDGRPLKINFTRNEATSGPDAQSGNAGFVLQFLQYTAPTGGVREFAITANDGTDTSAPVSVTLTGTDPLKVINTNDTGAGSLREALAAATSGDTITFDAAVTGTITLGSNLTVGDGVTIDFSGVVSALTIADTVTSSIPAGYSLVFGANSATLNVGTGDTVTLAAPMTSTTGAITKIGAGTLHLSAYGNGTGNSTVTQQGLDSGAFKGRVYINEGDITYLDRGMPDRVTLNGGQITHSNDNTYTGTITVGANGGTVKVSPGLGFSPSVAGSGTLTVEAASAGFNPSITDFTGDLIVKSGNFAPYELDANGLQLVVNSALVSQSIANNNIEVQTGATINSESGVLIENGKKLTGGGTINGPVVIGANGTIDAGTTSTAGRLTINGNLEIMGAGTLAGQIGGTAAGTGHDQIVVSGTVTLGATSIVAPALTGSFSPVTGDTFELIANNSSGPIAGTFNGAAQGSSVNAGSSNLNITYSGNNGNDLVLIGPDTTAPTLSISTPGDNALGVGQASNIELTFSENVTAVSVKNLVIHKTSDNSVVSTISATDAQVTIVNNVVTINPAADLDYSTEYYVLVDAGAFKDAANNNYAGISATTALSFTTTAAPTLTTIATLASGTANAANSITFSALATAANEADSDGTVEAFVVKAVTTGTLTIGGNAWAAGSNDTIDSNNAASWIPAANAVGDALSAFTVVAKDNNGGESATPIQVKLDVNAAPTLDITKSPAFNAALGAAAPVNGSTTGSVLVSDLINSDGAGLNNYADLNDAAPGLAVTGVNGGTLWYSTNAGANWTALSGTVSDSSALVLYANADTRVYYQPASDATAGTITDALNIRAWDHRGNVANGDAGVVLGSSGVGAVLDTVTVGVGRDLRELAGSGNYIFARDANDDGLIVFNVADPANITLVRSQALNDSFRDIKANGTHVYVANDNVGGLQIYAISDLTVIDTTNTSPVTAVGTYFNGAKRINSVELDGQVAYVGFRDSALVKLDISNPAVPVVLDTNNALGRYSDLAKIGNYLYAYDSNGADIKIFDTTNFTSAPVAAELPGSGINIDGLIQSGGKIWAWGVSGTTKGVFGFSVNSSTGALTQASFIATGSAYPAAISFNGTNAYVATDNGTLRFDLTATPDSTGGGVDTFSTPTGNYVDTNGASSVLATSNGVLVGIDVDLVSIDFNAVQVSNPFSSVSDTVAVTLTGGVTDTTAPAFVSASVSGTSLALTYDEPLAGTVPLAIAFTVKVNGSVVNSAVSTAALDGTNPAKLNLTLANALGFGDTMTISYTDAAGNDVAAIQDAAGNDAVSFADYGVTNTTAAASSHTFNTQLNGRQATLDVGSYNISAPSNSAAPLGLSKNVKMPLGQFAFSVTGLSNGATANLSMTVDSDLKLLTYYKWNFVTNKWTNIATGVENNTGTGKSTVKFALTDGGAYDADRTANGTIVDPGGLAENTLLPVLLENTTAVGDVTLQDTTQVNGTLSYAITAGADAAKFSVNTSTGALVFLSAPNYEAPNDLGNTAGNNTYTVDVRINGTNGGSELQSLIVTVLNVPEAGDPTVGSTVSAAEVTPVVTAPPSTGGGGGTPTPTPTPTPAPDTDGVPDTVENATPGLPPAGGGTPIAGDGNGDGVLDSQQSGVTSVSFLQTTTAVTNPSTAPTAFVSLVADARDGKIDTGDTNTATLTNVRQLDAPANLPDVFNTPLGLIAFGVSVGLNPSAPGGVGAVIGVTETFSLYVDPSLGANGFWLQNTEGVWVNLASAPYGGEMVSEGGRTRLDFQLTDGGEFDADGQVNGVMTITGAAGSMPLSLVGFKAEPVAGAEFWF